MRHLIDNGWSLSEATAEYGAFLLDKMHSLLDAEMAPYHNLVEVFKKQKTQESAADFEESRKDSNFMRQNRVTVTPTLIKFSAGEEEESNRVIRNFKSKLPNFI